MDNKERRIELQRLRDLAHKQWDAKSHELASMWGAVRFMDEQIAATDKLIQEEEKRKREAELNVKQELVDKYPSEEPRETSSMAKIADEESKQFLVKRN